MLGFRLRSEVFEDMERASSGVKQKNSSSADEDSPNLLEDTFETGKCFPIFPLEFLLIVWL